MGTKVHSESYFPGFYYMRDLNENSSNSNWPLFCGDKIVPNGQYYNGFVPRTLVDGYSGHDKDTLKQKMLEHEEVFKNQVCELHRLYRIQRDMMEDAKRKEIYYRASVEPASSSSHQGSQVPSEDAQKWHMAGFPLLNSSYGRTSIGGVENFSSPLSFTKGITIHPRQSPFQNGSTSKNFEALDSRPLKVRKKLFDLQLPADQYEDLEEEENLRDYKESDISSCSRDGNPNSGAESGAKLFIGSHVGKQIDRAMDVSASVSRLKGSTGLADLNEPIQIEEETAPSSVDFQVNDMGWLSHLNRAGSSRGNLSSVTQGYQPDKLPLPSHLGKGTYSSGYGREDLWREGFRHGLESSRTYDQSTNSHLGPIASQTPCSYPFLSSSSFASSWAYPISSWAKPTNSFTQNVTALETSTMSRTLHPSAPSNEYFGGKWAESSSRPIPGFASESKLNGRFDYLNCSRGDNVASNRSTNHGLGIFPKGSYADLKPVIDINLNETVIVQDLSTPDGKSRPEDVLRTLPWLKPKPVHVKEVSGTSRSELSRELSSFRSSPNQLCCLNETVRDVNQLFPSKVTLTSCHSEISRKKESGQTQTVQKILGVPIFERVVPENEPSSHASTSVNIDCQSEGKIVSNERKKVIIDINVACEPDEQIAVEEEVNVANEKQKNSVSINHFDLNSCVSDSEDPPVPCSEQRAKMEIDLELPIFLESEDDSTLSKEKMSDEILPKHEEIQDEVLKNVTETLVSISSRPPQEDDIICLPSEASVEEALHWFVNVVSSCNNNTSRKESRIGDDEMDDFEAMTLQLAETREEDYMPTPFVPENQETGGSNALATRSRRGHSRRGRQRRDFQRDILPGLTSLSRHEVTEDLQTFGGLMRATGHSWNSGFNRRNGTRNGGGRGRRRAVVETVPIPVPVCTPLIQQLNTTEAGLEDRSLTGWGKTTRRPRRQRCHAAGGNPPTVALT
ncbi:hypothetical protein ACS0TY_008881 [Phlomoides rotata]